jgi:hypothetical protein
MEGMCDCDSSSFQRLMSDPQRAWRPRRLQLDNAYVPPQLRLKNVVAFGSTSAVQQQLRQDKSYVDIFNKVWTADLTAKEINDNFFSDESFVNSFLGYKCPSTYSPTERFRGACLTTLCDYFENGNRFYMRFGSESDTFKTIQRLGFATAFEETVEFCRKYKMEMEQLCVFFRGFAECQNHCSLIYISMRMKIHPIQIEETALIRILELVSDVIVWQLKISKAEFMSFVSENASNFCKILSNKQTLVSQDDVVRHNVISMLLDTISASFTNTDDENDSRYVHTSVASQRMRDAVKRISPKAPASMISYVPVVVVSNEHVTRQMVHQPVKTPEEIIRDRLTSALRNCQIGEGKDTKFVNGHDGDISINVGNTVRIWKDVKTKLEKKVSDAIQSDNQLPQLIECVLVQGGKNERLNIKLLVNVINQLMNNATVSDNLIIELIETFPSARFRNFLRNIILLSKYKLPLISAAIWNLRVGLARYLIENHADMTAVNSDGETPFEVFRSITPTENANYIEMMEFMSSFTEDESYSKHVTNSDEADGFTKVTGKRQRNRAGRSSGRRW